MATSRVSRAVKLVGTDVPEGKRRLLRAGVISAVLDNGALRYIRLNDIEVLRAIAFLVRDENWGTFTPEITDLKVRERPDGFTVAYHARCGTLVYRAEITGSTDGVVKFAATATPETDFRTNRTGFVVLHPLNGVAGRPVTLEHVDGRKAKDKFPAVINPVQPFYELRAMTQSPMPGVNAEVRFEGDTFETEDHRNWTDASFKTYVRPLALPWPYTLPKGEPVSQSVTLTLSGKLPRPKRPAAPKPVEVSLGRAAGEMPRIASGVPIAEADAALERAELIAAAGLKQLIFRFDGRKSGIAGLAKTYREIAAATGVEASLEIVIPGKDDPASELRPIAAAINESGLAPIAVAVSPAIDLKAVLPGSKGGDGPSLEAIYKAARAAFPGVALGGGMFSYFTELNRKNPPAELLDFVTHTSCPIVHAADDISVMETLEALPYVAASAKAIVQGKPYHIGPSSIPARDNPYGAGVAPNPDNGRVCLSDMDPRQRGLFGAAWTLGLVKAFAEGGVASVALGAVTGPQGMIYRRCDYPQPYFDGGKALLYPLYHVVAGLAQASGAKRIAAQSAVPSAIAALAYRRQGPVLWLANLTADPQRVKVKGLSGGAVAHAIDEASFVKATADPGFLSKAGEKLKRIGTLDLGPYAVMRIAAA